MPTYHVQRTNVSSVQLPEQITWTKIDIFVKCDICKGYFKIQACSRQQQDNVFKINKCSFWKQW